MKICTIPGCEKPEKAKGWCAKHHQRWRRHGDPLATYVPKQKCQVEGCPSKAYADQIYCYNHYYRYMRYGDVNGAFRAIKSCALPGCNGPHRAKGLCVRHYAETRKKEKAPV